MPPLFAPFLGSGGLALAVLGVLSWIAFARLPSIQDSAARWVAALSTPWLMKAAVALALLAWVWAFGRLFAGDGYLRGAGSFAELSTGLAGAGLAAAITAWRGIRPGSRFRPWRTHGIVLVLLLVPGWLVLPAPDHQLSQGVGPEDRHAVSFVQRRLAYLGCFAAVGEPPRRDGNYDALTALAVIAFQQANGLLVDPRLDTEGVVRPHAELRLLARPFPFLFGPEPCRG